MGRTTMSKLPAKDEHDDLVALRDDPEHGLELLQIYKPFSMLSKAERLAISAALCSHRNRRRWRRGDPPLGSRALESWIAAEYPDKEKHKDEIAEIRRLHGRATFLKQAMDQFAKRQKLEARRKETIRLYYAGQHTVAEIAHMQGVSVGVIYRDVAKHRRDNGLPKERRARPVNYGTSPSSPVPPVRDPIVQQDQNDPLATIIGVDAAARVRSTQRAFSAPEPARDNDVTPNSDTAPEGASPGDEGSVIDHAKIAEIAARLAVTDAEAEAEALAARRRREP